MNTTSTEPLSEAVSDTMFTRYELPPGIEDQFQNLNHSQSGESSEFGLRWRTGEETDKNGSGISPQDMAKEIAREQEKHEIEEFFSPRRRSENDSGSHEIGVSPHDATGEIATEHEQENEGQSSSMFPVEVRDPAQNPIYFETRKTGEDRHESSFGADRPDARNKQEKPVEAREQAKKRFYTETRKSDKDRHDSRIGAESPDARNKQGKDQDQTTATNAVSCSLWKLVPAPKNRKRCIFCSIASIVIIVAAVVVVGMIFIDFDDMMPFDSVDDTPSTPTTPAAPSTKAPPVTTTTTPTTTHPLVEYYNLTVDIRVAPFFADFEHYILTKLGEKNSFQFSFTYNTTATNKFKPDASFDADSDMVEVWEITIMSTQGQSVTVKSRVEVSTKDGLLGRSLRRNLGTAQHCAKEWTLDVNLGETDLVFPQDDLECEWGIAGTWNYLPGVFVSLYDPVPDQDLNANYTLVLMDRVLPLFEDYFEEVSMRIGTTISREYSFSLESDELVVDKYYNSNGDMVEHWKRTLISVYELLNEAEVETMVKVRAKPELGIDTNCTHTWRVTLDLNAPNLTLGTPPLYCDWGFLHTWSYQPGMNITNEWAATTATAPPT